MPHFGWRAVLPGLLPPRLPRHDQVPGVDGRQLALAPLDLEGVGQGVGFRTQRVRAIIGGQFQALVLEGAMGSGQDSD